MFAKVRRLCAPLACNQWELRRAALAWGLQSSRDIEGVRLSSLLALSSASSRRAGRGRKELPMRPHRLSLTLSLLLACILSAPGCDAPNDDGLPDVEVSASGKSDGTTVPTGSYENVLANADLRENEVVTLTLKDDTAYEMTTWVEDQAEPLNGTYGFSKAGETNYIRLYEGDGLIARYAYTYRDGVLRLRLQGTTSWSELKAGEVTEPSARPCRLALRVHPEYHADFADGLAATVRTELAEHAPNTELVVVLSEGDAASSDYYSFVGVPTNDDKVIYGMKAWRTGRMIYADSMDAQEFNVSVSGAIRHIAADLITSTAYALNACSGE
jgi:hypothetical protein